MSRSKKSFLLRIGGELLVSFERCFRGMDLSKGKIVMKFFIYLVTNNYVDSGGWSHCEVLSALGA